MRELMVVEDVLRKSTFPVLLPAGASARPPLANSGPLGPHVIERGGMHADEALHREKVKNTLLEQNTCERLP